MEVRLVTRKVRAVYLLERDVLADVLIEGSMTIQRRFDMTRRKCDICLYPC
jgi:hypothetical protein